MVKLFSQHNLGKLSIKNRIIMPPMCLYKVSDDSGKPNEFHDIHYTCRAMGGVGAIIVEATAVEARGRITNKDLGLWSDEQVEAHLNLVSKIKKYGAKVGIQLAHAGRKSMCVDSTPISSCDIKFSDEYKAPVKMSLDDIDSLKQSFINSAIRAKKAGYEFIEIHAAHGYLINQFLSKKLNTRDDEYGKDRLKLLRDIFIAVKNATDCVVGVRLSASSWQSDDYDIDFSIEICKELERLGVDFLHISSSGVYPVPDKMPEIRPLYQAEYAKAIKDVVNVPVIAVGLIRTGAEGEALLICNACDFVAYGRELLANPNLAYKMAAELKEYNSIDTSYIRAFR